MVAVFALNGHFLYRESIQATKERRNPKPSPVKADHKQLPGRPWSLEAQTSAQARSLSSFLLDLTQGNGSIGLEAKIPDQARHVEIRKKSTSKTKAKYIFEITLVYLDTLIFSLRTIYSVRLVEKIFFVKIGLFFHRTAISNTN